MGKGRFLFMVLGMKLAHAISGNVQRAAQKHHTRLSQARKACNWQRLWQAAPVTRGPGPDAFLMPKIHEESPPSICRPAHLCRFLAQLQANGSYMDIQKPAFEKCACFPVRFVSAMWRS